MLRGLGIYGGIFDVENKRVEIGALEQKMAAVNFWENQEVAQEVIAEVNLLKKSIDGIVVFSANVVDLQAHFELVLEMEEGIDGQEFLKELDKLSDGMLQELDALEIKSFLSGKMDHCNAILSIHAGAGGTESCDWAEMLLRQYKRWAERRQFQVDVLDLQMGEEAGISSVSMRISGDYTYGYCKAERGVHRLVRISPFDSNKRRHTSFCSVDVIAEIEDDIEIEIQDEDIRIDTYRASGKGGQHINKTDSAVRITHMPTNIVVQCQNERSQLKNKGTAMKQLKSRLYEYEQDKQRVEMERFYGEKGEIGWGNQIRSYVFQPYQMVKDLRTGVETGNIQAVQDGDLDRFIHAWLRAGCPTQRNKDIQIEA